MNEEFLERITKDAAVNWAKETYGDPRYKDLPYLTDLKMAYSAGVQAGRDEGMYTERERCAKVAEKTFKSTEAKYGMTWYLYHEDIAAAISGQKNG